MLTQPINSTTPTAPSRICRPAFDRPVICSSSGTMTARRSSQETTSTTVAWTRLICRAPRRAKTSAFTRTMDEKLKFSETGGFLLGQRERLPDFRASLVNGHREQIGDFRKAKIGREHADDLVGLPFNVIVRPTMPRSAPNRRRHNASSSTTTRSRAWRFWETSA